ncbi:xylulokinase [Microbacterium sp. NPDC058342]|uniref:xylulokinase n=1 Tax=Microbacterium sp. NPDC058342 TaxID=3346454 RepID=UPI003647F0AB
MTLVAGVDSSTQSCKVVICDADTGRVVRSGRAAHPSGTEVDPQAWWDALQQAIAEAGGIDDVAAISVGGQQHGCVVLDAEGAVIRPALLWNDTRTAGDADRLVRERGDDGARWWAEATGLVPVASFTVSKLAWIARNEPDNAARIAAVCLPHDWLTWRLAGNEPGRADLNALTTDRSDASGTGYFDAETGTYREDIVEGILGRMPVLPRVLGPAERAGTTSSGAVLGPGAGDNAAAALGIGARTGDLVVSVGTSGTVFAVSDIPTRDASGLVAGFADATGRYLPLACTLNASLVLDATARLLGVDHVAFDELASSGASDGLRLVPYLSGERTPNLPDATGSLLGITLGNLTPAALARAAVEGVVCSLVDACTAVERAGVRGSRALFVGGGARYRALQDAARATFALPVGFPEPAEYVALGMARQAASVLTGKMPDWATHAAVSAGTGDTEPLAAYRRATATLWGDSAIR